jgi:hypothetical protein
MACLHCSLSKGALGISDEPLGMIRVVAECRWR